jgi:hypothetical protein
LFCCCWSCTVSLTMLQTPSGLTVVIIFSCLVWTLNALSLEASFCAVVSTVQLKFRRMQCHCCTYISLHSTSTMWCSCLCKNSCTKSKQLYRRRASGCSALSTFGQILLQWLSNNDVISRRVQ